MEAVGQYGLRGVEFGYARFRDFRESCLLIFNHSWEYPAKQGIGCNIVSVNDTANFLSFLQTLRSMAGPDLVISAAVAVTPFVGPDGSTLTDVSGFEQVLDFIGPCLDGVNLET
jgi:hypothetical protein